MERYKYPRTYHFSFSEGASNDDKILEDDNIFEGKKIVITTKMDGENTTIYSDGSFHARSLDSKHRDYHSWLLSYIPTFSYLILDDNIRICGEYLYAKHSIKYDNLPSYFMMFSAWDKNKCLDWEDTVYIAAVLGLVTVPILYEGVFDLNKVKEIARKTIAAGQEGIVVRNYDSFDIADFSKNVAKVVRKNHVQTDEHWMYSQIEKNNLTNLK